MSFDPGRALGLDPPDRIVLSSPKKTMSWARSIPDFGCYTEVYALFLDADHVLLRAAWLGSATGLEDFTAWPDFALGYAPAAGAAAVLLLACRPGEGTDPSPTDLATYDLIRVAQAAHDLPLLDVLLVGGGGRGPGGVRRIQWSSLAEEAGR
jgi:DNA repair protein RadC